MLDDEEISDAPPPAIGLEQLIEVKTAEELAALIYKNLKALGNYAMSGVECDNSIQFLAGSLSSIQLQNMALLGYIQYLGQWCHTAAGRLQMAAPWDFEVWEHLNTCKDAKEARDYLALVNKERRSKERHIKLLGES